MVGAATGEVDYTSLAQAFNQPFVICLARIQNHQRAGVSTQAGEVGYPVVCRFGWVGDRRCGDNHHSRRTLARSSHNLPVHILTTLAELLTADKSNFPRHLLTSRFMTALSVSSHYTRL